MLRTDTYVQRRAGLMDRLESGLVLLIGHDDSPMNFVDNPYPFWQDSSFLYYIGLNEPGLAALLDVDEKHCTLFGHERTLDEIVWTGELPTLAERGAEAGITDCRPPAELEARVAAARESHRTLHCLPPYRDTTRMKLGNLLGLAPTETDNAVSTDLVRAVVAQRSIKSAEEVAEIELAVALAREIHTLAMRRTRPGMKEQEIVGAVEGHLLARSSAISFPVIFSRRGEVLHNHGHENILDDGDLVILDAGALSPTGYASDITRTFPVSPSYSARQREIYEIVLSAEERAIAACEPGRPYEEIHLLAARTVAEGLKDLGLMKGDLDAAVDQGAHALFFPHGLGHMMGLDVHDMESLGEDHVGYDESVSRSTQFGRAYLRLAKRLEPGHVITVEPGIYFIPQLIDSWAADGKLADFIAYDRLEEWKSFGGVRIEDDVLVTAEGHRILGEPIPKSVADVEALRTQ